MGRAEEKTGRPGTQNNANNAMNFTSSSNNLNKNNSYIAVPFFDCTRRGIKTERFCFRQKDRMTEILPISLRQNNRTTDFFSDRTNKA